MSLNLTKNQPLNLTKAAPSLKNVRIGLGWDATRSPNAKPIDVDVSLFITDENLVLINDAGSYNGLIGYANPDNTFSGCLYGGDERVGSTGEDDGLQEYIDFDTTKANPRAKHLVIAASIYAGIARKHFFANVRNAYVCLIDIDRDEEVARLNLTDLGGQNTGAVFGILSINSMGEWIFNSSDVVTTTGLSGLLAAYGLPGVPQEVDKG